MDIREITAVSLYPWKMCSKTPWWVSESTDSMEPYRYHRYYSNPIGTILHLRDLPPLLFPASLIYHQRISRSPLHLHL